MSSRTPPRRSRASNRRQPLGRHRRRISRLHFDEARSGGAGTHGLCRARFATWAYEAAGAREEIVEACLAHKEADRVKAAYDRSQDHAARRRLLQAWADFVNGKAPALNLI